jgi:hypothetical protein
MDREARKSLGHGAGKSGGCQRKETHFTLGDLRVCLTIRLPALRDGGRGLEKSAEAIVVSSCGMKGRIIEFKE